MGKVCTLAAASFSAFCFCSSVSMESGWPLMEAMTVRCMRVCRLEEAKRVGASSLPTVSRITVGPECGRLSGVDWIWIGKLRVYWDLPCSWTARIQTRLFGPGHSFLVLSLFHSSLSSNYSRKWTRHIHPSGGTESSKTFLVSNPLFSKPQSQKLDRAEEISGLLGFSFWTTMGPCLNE